MNEHQIKGQFKKIKGKVNEAVGKVTGDKTQEVKGKIQQAVAEGQILAGDIQEELEDKKS